MDTDPDRGVSGTYQSYGLWLLSFTEIAPLFSQEVCGSVFTLEPNGGVPVVFLQAMDMFHIIRVSVR